ncbi:RsmB/NOP family class I SAM-dependent RNA methyltransferase [Aneurinibacillus sp. Ricciae_BoGa-3]|uniref:RsmB/NOP family class I SAM-dependent RNA methyltransferase n=1 Tax=Aneurinibacillus sp. Ricciae_BoGa-3 TaxID=3022697 RepID=UPI0023407018|nr:RsmB/NOP family class I SAM-dependent RNA methyltransferase [Aneurinibacillus sp. Ricciae_BoGa-3]WCK55696.1 RsmB/NOP family class I SAM-dependent RNA methyltransferase [Aneurinibacillus sp. Ricciae_BoGa-3]
MQLPQAFIERMERLLGGDFPAFVASYDQPRRQGLRANRLKIDAAELKKRLNTELSPVAWTVDGFYYPQGFRPAKHPYYHAGLYYIQEPSAMAPAVILNPSPGERVLDLCAAPGGKTVQLAAALGNSGILVTNDNNPNRVKALVKNVERYGLTRTIVTNETPDKLAAVFGEYFDRVLVDAPCSGEGMFRKEPDMIKSWSPSTVEACTSMQQPILEDAARMLKAGGWLLYSTCTFAPEENEQMIASFLETHPEFTLMPIPMHAGWDAGRPEWTNEGNKQLKNTVRLWPHKINGEGHYLALLQKQREQRDKPAHIQERRINERELEDFYAFVQDTLPNWNGFKDPGVRLTLHEDRLFLTPAEAPPLHSLRLARQGWLLGSFKKKRFEPSQAFAMGITASDAVKVVRFIPDDPNVIRYLKGETLMIQADKGWNLVCLDNFPLGWAKGAGGMLKNMYPPGWRWIDGGAE